jgi:hypothetical protein
MSDVRQTVTHTANTGVNDEGAIVQQETKHIQTESSASRKITAENIVWYILGVVEILLAFRFILKIFGANSSSSFVSFVYSVTGILSAPFDSIFRVSSATTGTTHSVFEPSILVAAVVYAVIAWGIVKIMGLNNKD